MSSMHLSQVRRWLLQSPPVEWAIMQLRELLIGALRQGPVPQHVAFVMDGNRRFARSHGIETVEGHNLGFEALARVHNERLILEVCYKSGVKVVTVYAFSIENFKRSKYEVDALMDMAKVKLLQLAQHGDLLDRYGASVRVLGRRELLKEDVLEAIDRSVGLTKHNKQAILNICFPYTSHDEMTTAIRDTVIDYSAPLPSQTRSFSQSHITHTIRARRLSSVAATLKVRSHSPSSGGTSDTEDSMSSSTTLHPDSPPPDTTPIEEEEEEEEDEVSELKKFQRDTYPDPETITSEILSDHMFTASLPPLDLLVRTSGVERLSDFMLWQCHQETDIVFLKCLWPDFDLWTFLPVILEWQWKRRRSVQREKGAGPLSQKLVKSA